MSSKALRDDCHSMVGALELGLGEAKSGLTTCVIQFGPGKESYGDFAIQDDLLTKLVVFPALRVSRFNKDGSERASDGLALARLALVCGRYDLVILDGVPNAIKAGDIHAEEIRKLVSIKTKTRLITI
jgi:ATP:corrinoid adenosyltransferase